MGEEGQSLQTFDDFNTFVKRLRDEKLYDEGHFKLEGPRGAALSIHMLGKRSRLEIKSSISPDEFPNLVQIFKNNLGLKKIAETREAAEIQKSAVKDSLWVLIVLPLFITILTNAILTDQVKNAPYSKNTLEIISPLKNNDKSTILPQRDVSIVWHIRHEKWFRAQVLRDVRAHLQIFNASGTTAEEKLDASPGVRVQLEPGFYQAVITVNDYGLSEKVSFEIPTSVKP